jgi:hypothetical protein
MTVKILRIVHNNERDWDELEEYLGKGWHLLEITTDSDDAWHIYHYAFIRSPQPTIKPHVPKVRCEPAGKVPGTRPVESFP